MIGEHVAAIQNKLSKSKWLMYKVIWEYIENNVYIRVYIWFIKHSELVVQPNVEKVKGSKYISKPLWIWHSILKPLEYIILTWTFKDLTKAETVLFELDLFMCTSLYGLNQRHEKRESKRFFKTMPDI